MPPFPGYYSKSGETVRFRKRLSRHPDCRSIPSASDYHHPGATYVRDRNWGLIASFNASPTTSGSSPKSFWKRRASGKTKPEEWSFYEDLEWEERERTINSKINCIFKGFYLTIFKLHSFLAVGNLLAYNNLWLCYYVQVNSVRLK